MNTLQFWFIAANVLTGIAMLSLAAAVLWATRHRRWMTPWLNYAFVLFFLFAGVGRLLSVFVFAHAQVRNGWDFWIEAITGIMALSAAWMVWPLAVRTVRMPTYRDLQRASTDLATANRQLEIARDDALQSSQLKSSFVANISHELRTPLSAILGMSELVLATEELSKDGRMMMDAVLDSGNALLAIVNDILDLSKIEAGKIELDHVEFSPRSVIEDCVQLLMRGATTKGLALELAVDRSLPPVVFGDPQRVRQILLNLVSNAIKFTQQGTVRVSAKAQVENEDVVTIKIVVEDTGIGISPDERKLLFMPFTQADNSSTRKFGGTGLGLTISKRFVEMMHGEIDFSSEKGKGSAFWFAVPFERAGAEHQHISSHHAA